MLMIRRKKQLCIVFLLLLFMFGISFLYEEKIDKEFNQTSYQENVELAIYLNDKETNTIPSKDSGYYYDREKSTCSNGAYINWDSVSWSPVVNNMSEYKTRCELHFTTTYTEGILNGADPVLKDELVPITIENNGTVKKADIKSEWYSYEKKNWANAVILFDESEDYLAGEVIPEEKIESYFVWIPKYRYQLWDLGQYDSLTEIDESKAHEIPIIFGDYTTLDEREGECTTPMESGATGNCTVGDYMTHPAFLSIPSTGFWVGKFETGYRGATSSAEAEQNVNDPSKIIIKPNTYSWRGVQLANAFYSSYNYQRELDSHMMKNTEWGAVAYLQHSAYGSATSVRINNYSDYVTGYAANNEPACGWTNSNEECNRYCNDGTCNTAYPNSNSASTTGNISGIYDMSGGTYEYVMGVMQDTNGNLMSGGNNLNNSGFNGSFNDGGSLTTGYDWPEEKYYDSYLYYDRESDDTYYRFQRRILGDATGEMGPFYLQTLNNVSRAINSWYRDQGVFIYSDLPYFWRGSGYSSGTNTGIFSFSTDSGHESSFLSFRLILTMKND